MSFRLTAEKIGSRPCNLDPSFLGAMVTLSFTPALDRVELHPGASATGSAQAANKIAVISIRGPLEQRATAHLCGVTDGYDAIYSRFQKALSNPEVAAVLLSIDSPGGRSHGNIENAKAMRAAKAKYGKPVVAYADEIACSAAFAIACVADEIYLPRSGVVGSVGTRTFHADYSKSYEETGVSITEFASGTKKLTGSPYRPLSNEDKAEIQSEIDALGTQFSEFVGLCRGMSTQAVLDLQAATFSGEDAVAKGLADGVRSLSEVAALMVEKTKAAKATNEETSMLDSIQKALAVDSSEAILPTIASLQEMAATAKPLSEQVTQLQAKLDAFEAAKVEAAKLEAEASKQKDILAALDKGEADGKVTPARRTGLLEKAQLHGVEWLTSLLDESPVVMATAPVVEAKRSTIDKALLETFNRLGISEEDYRRSGIGNSQEGI